MRIYRSVTLKLSKFIPASFRKVKTVKIYNCCHTYVQGIKVLREIEEYAKAFQIC
jgi:hypothetical protein